MAFIFSNTDFIRKVRNIKDDLYIDGFYSDTSVARVKNLTGASGRYNRGVTITYTDTLVSGIAEYGPEFRTFDELIETIDGDVRYTVRETDAGTISAANEIWLNTTITNGNVKTEGYPLITEAGNALVTESGTPLYTDGRGDIASGTMYKVHSQKRSLFQRDRIFILRLGGEQG